MEADLGVDLDRPEKTPSGKKCTFSNSSSFEGRDLFHHGS